MSAIFPKWTNKLPFLVLVGGTLTAVAVTAGVWYYCTPKYFRVGYQPIQPVAFSHATHAGQLGIEPILDADMEKIMWKNAARLWKIESRYLPPEARS